MEVWKLFFGRSSNPVASATCRPIRQYATTVAVSPMLIESIEIFHVAMPLIQPWRTAYGEDATIESVLVRMTGGGSGLGRIEPVGCTVL